MSAVDRSRTWASSTLIEAIARALGDPPERARPAGSGDDAAVVRARPFAVTSIDTMVDGVHFRLGQASPADAGHRALAGALSDLAAMGADPGEAYVALGLPAGLRPQADALERRSTAMAAARRARRGTAIAGGDVTARARADDRRDRRRAGPTREDDLVGRDGARPGRRRRRHRPARRVGRRPGDPRGARRRAPTRAGRRATCARARASTRAARSPRRAPRR